MVRFAEEKDIGKINELRKQVNDIHVEGRPDLFKAGFGVEIRDFAKVIMNAENSDIIVAERNDVICGMVCVDMVSKRHPSSRSRLKNLLMLEGVSETYARREIADLDTEAGCMVIEEYGSLKLNQKLLSQMFLQIQSELKIPNYFEEEYKTQMAVLERKIEKLEKEKSNEFDALKLENEKKNGVIMNILSGLCMC